MSQPKSKAKSQPKPFDRKKSADIRKVEVPKEWFKVLHDSDSQSFVDLLDPHKYYTMAFPCGGELRIIIQPESRSVSVCAYAPETQSVTGAGHAPVTFSNRFEDGYSSYMYTALLILAVAIELQDCFEIDDVSILNIPAASSVNDFLRGPANQHPSDDVMNMFSRSDRLRYIKSEADSETRLDSLCMCLVGRQTMFISTGYQPSCLTDMSRFDLSSMPSLLANALLGIPYASIMDEKKMHASIGAHLKVGGPIKSRVPSDEGIGSNGS
jgi:hypothetical protein